MSSEAKQSAGGLQSMVPALIIACVVAMLGLAGQIDGWKAARGGAAPAVASAAAPSASAAAQVGDGERGRIETIVRDYLLKNPEILVEMQQVYEARAEAKREAQMAEALTTHSQDLFHAPRTPVAGNAQGDVTVVEFFDYNCGYCRRAIADVAKLIETDKNVRVVFKEFPIFGKDSEAAARVAIAAKAQGKYWEVHRALFEHEGKHGEATALEVAQKAGLDMEKLKADMSSPETEKEIAEVRTLAETMGIQGTPHFFIGDKVIPGAPEDLYDQLVANIGEVRKNGCTVC